MRYLIAIHHPDSFDPSQESEETCKNIDELNEQMEAAGVRLFAGGLRPVLEAKSLKATEGLIEISDGPYLPGSVHMGGFWMLECSSMEEALEWGRKAVKACRTPVEVRPFY